MRCAPSIPSSCHSKLLIQANAYMNATRAIAVAKAVNEDGSGPIGGSISVARAGKKCSISPRIGGRSKYTAITGRAGVIEPNVVDEI
jgi:hypothetical protein